jgi:hypothetical protein
MSEAAGQAKVVDNASMKVLDNAADRTKRIAAADPASTGRAANASNAKSAVNNANNKNFVAGSVSADAAQTGSDVIRATPDKKPSIYIKPVEMVRDNKTVIRIQ